MVVTGEVAEPAFARDEEALALGDGGEPLAERLVERLDLGGIRLGIALIGSAFAGSCSARAFRMYST